MICGNCSTPDIFEYVRGSEIWFDPQSGERFAVAPFLEVVPTKDKNAQAKYTCSIYLDRPEDCRHYPSLINEMVRDECEMIEVIDLQDTKKAQRKLDILMKDSRPLAFHKHCSSKQPPVLTSHYLPIRGKILACF